LVENFLAIYLVGGYNGGEGRGGATVLTREDILAIAELMDERLKPITEDLAGVKQDLAGVKQDLAGVKQDLAGVKQDLAGVKQDLAGVKQDLADVKDQVVAVDQKATETRILLETEVDRAIKVLGEGHQGIIDTIKTQVTQDQLEEVSVRVFALEEGFKEHSEQIEELQQKIS